MRIITFLIFAVLYSLPVNADLGRFKDKQTIILNVITTITLSDDLFKILNFHLEADYEPVKGQKRDLYTSIWDEYCKPKAK